MITKEEREQKRIQKQEQQRATSLQKQTRSFSDHWKGPPVGRVRLLRNISHPAAGLAYDRGLSTDGAYFTSAGSYMPRGSGVYEIERFCTTDAKPGPIDQAGWWFELRSWSCLFTPGVMPVQWMPTAMELVP